MANWQRALMTAFNIRAGEGWPLLILMAHWFLNGLCVVFYYTAANTLFLGDFSTQSLPYVYVAAAVVSTSVGLAYSKCESSISITALLKGTLACVFLSLVLLWSVYALTNSRWVSACLMVWRDVVWILLSIEVWAIAGLVFNVRQAKRLFGLIEVGQILSGILGGLSVPLLLSVLDVENLLLIAAGALCISFLLLTYAVRAFQESFAATEQEEEDDDATRGFRDMFRSRYIVLGPFPD